MNLQSLQQKARDLRQQYALLEKKNGHQWTTLNIMEGFVGDVGDLMKLVMAKEGVRKIPGVDQKLAHELSDCLWSLFVLADTYNIDMEKTFLQTMAELEQRIHSEMGNQ
jgi:NTP pyrophosphatase (non-canonical NTP hydrolase)